MLQVGIVATLDFKASEGAAVKDLQAARQERKP